MNLTKELIEQWEQGIDPLQLTENKYQYIAQRAAEWALQQPVSMEPVTVYRCEGCKHEYMEQPSSCDCMEYKPFTRIDYYTQSQLAAARQQGAEEEREGRHPDWVLAYAKTIANCLWSEHYCEESPEWKVLPDLAGVLSQIDNMVSGLNQRIEELNVEVTKAWNEAEIYRKGCAHHQHRVTYITDEIVSQFNQARKVYGESDIHVQGAFDYLQDSLHIQLNKGGYPATKAGRGIIVSDIAAIRAAIAEVKP